MAIANQSFQTFQSRTYWNKLPNQFKIKKSFISLMAQFHVKFRELSFFSSQGGGLVETGGGSSKNN